METFILDIVLPNAENPIKTKIKLCFGAESLDVFELEGIGDIRDLYGKLIYQGTTGLSKQDAIKYKETDSDAYIFGLVNAQPNGQIFFFTNTSRLAFEIDSFGVLSLSNYLGHELLHLVRIIQAQAIWGTNFLNEHWPTIGGDITEADTAELQGVIFEAVTPAFMDFLQAFTEYG